MDMPRFYQGVRVIHKKISNKSNPNILKLHTQKWRMRLKEYV